MGIQDRDYMNEPKRPPPDEGGFGAPSGGERPERRGSQGEPFQYRIGRSCIRAMIYFGIVAAVLYLIAFVLKQIQAKNP
jgi:hypothetical protein